MAGFVGVVFVEEICCYCSMKDDNHLLIIDMCLVE